jgi:hypothetical protein
MKCRRVTEGIIQALMKKNELEPANVTLGEFVNHKGWNVQLNINVNLISFINYIRLYGNRAAHFHEYEFSNYDLTLVRTALYEVILFYYKVIGKEIPKDISISLIKYSNHKNQATVYNLDENLYLNALIAIENSEENYPYLGLKLLSNICSKILVDSHIVIPEELFSSHKAQKFLDVSRAVIFMKKNRVISDLLIAQLNESATFFKGSIAVSKSTGHIPEAPIKLKESFRELTRWFFKKEHTNIKKSTINYALLIIDLINVLLLLSVTISGIPHLDISTINQYFFLSIAILAGLALFYFAFLYHIILNLSNKFQNRKLYNFAFWISSYSGLIGVFILITISNYILSDGRTDGPFVYFFISTFLWSLALQISIYIRSGVKMLNNRVLRLISIISLLIIIILSIYYSSKFVW